LAVLALAGVPLPEEEGRNTVESACSACHTLDVVTSQRLSNKQWRETVETMTARGARLTPVEADQAVQYLAAHFGPVNRGRELVLDVCSQCHELDRVKDQALTRAEWTEVIKGMISEGPPVTDEEFSMIVDYLAANFGRPEKQP
jgi:mono/diheme cytochrome c family protein